MVQTRMNIPETFKPGQNLDKRTEELMKRKYPKITDIEDLILDSKGIGKNYADPSYHQMLRQEFKQFYHTIGWGDIEENFKVEHRRKHGLEYGITVHILGYLDQKYLKKNFDDILREIDSLNMEDRSSYIYKALVIDRYAIIIFGRRLVEEALDRMEELYRENFGAKGIVKKREKVSVQSNEAEEIVEKKQWFELK